MRAILSLEQLRQILDRAIMGEKIAHLAVEYGSERTAVVHRLKRRFPEEYAKLTAAGLISSVPSEAARKRRADAAAQRWMNDPAVLEYLNGNGTYHQIAEKYNLSYSTLRGRVRRAIDYNRKNNSHDQTSNTKLTIPAPWQDAHISPESAQPLPAAQLAAQPAAVARAIANLPSAADYSDILTSVEILQDLQPGKRAP